ncbi:alpha/beta hydrolase [Trebonia kvetii]|uniref:Alpha/beta hydrolase n=1 Tax=Trebonia kvetii TaxID=2480626 RepID=A0A6P2BL42_9ACTN|nr:alpha/beta hydrolase [Trebonia kvetii]TVY99605.1 alpha/beta hydrolase [Trebonia kvetii]
MTFTLDAEVAAVLQAALEENGPPPAWPAGDVQARRVALDAMLDYFNNQAQPPAQDVEITDHQVTAADGATLLARWYRLPSSDVGAAVLYLHGGGMILGSVPIFDGPVSRYVARTGVPMLSVQYRLAPEHPHPVPVEDAYAGLAWLAGHAAELGIDPGRIAVMGDSAGGGLAAGVAIVSRDRQGPAIAGQLLLYPMLDDRTTAPDPFIAPFAGWSYGDNATGWDALLGAGHENRDVDPAAAPARLKDARSLPPAYIEVGQLDVFRDEALRYALTLSQAGVPVELHMHPGVPHEYDAIAFDADVSLRAQADRSRVLRSL